MPDIRVQDEQGNIHVFPDGSTPDMIAKAMNVQVAPQDHLSQDVRGPALPPIQRTGVAGSIERTTKGLIDLPGHIHQAFSAEPQNDEEKFGAEVIAKFMPQVPKESAAGVYRLFVAPLVAERKKAIALQDQAKLAEMEGQNADELHHMGNVHGIGSMVPVIGPMAADIVHRYISGDKSGAITDLGTAIAGPKVAEGTLKGVAAGSKMAAPVVAKVVKTGAAIGEPLPVIGEAVDQLARLNKFTKLPQKIKDIWTPEAAAESAASAVPAGTAEEVAKPPQLSQVLKDSGVTEAMKKAGVAAPSATVRPIRPSTGSLGITGEIYPRSDLQIPAGLSGEDAARIQLTRYSISELRSGALKRGLKITPSDTHSALINKIFDSMKPEELQGFSSAALAAKVTPSKFPTNNLVADQLNEAAAGIQAAKGSPYEVASLRNAAQTVRGYGEDISKVDLAQTKIRGIDKRITKRINDALQGQNAVPAGDEVQTTAGQPMSMAAALRQSLIQRGIKPPN